MMVLRKDSEVILAHSDRFSLLPNEFEYEIKVLPRVLQTNDQTTSGQDQVKPTTPLCSESTKEEESVSSSSGQDKEEPTTVRIKKIAEINENLEAGNMATSLSQIIAQSTGAQQLTANEIEGAMDSDHDRTPSPDALRNLMPGMIILQQSQVTASQVDSSANQTRANKRSHDSDNDESSPKKQRSLSASPPILPSNADQISITIESTSTTTIKIKPDPDSSQIPVAGTSATKVDLNIVKPDPDAVKVKTETSTNVQPAVAGNQNTNVPSARPSCEHGIRCFRSHPTHRRDFAHPKDSDYRRPNFPPAPATAPQCPWGTACYRRNPDHFVSLQHPPSNVYSPQPVATQPMPRNVTSGIQNQDSDDDDGDMNEESEFDDSDVNIFH